MVFSAGDVPPAFVRAMRGFDNRNRPRRSLATSLVPPGRFDPADYTAPPQSARNVLDIHADLHRMLSRMDAQMRRQFEQYAVEDSLGHRIWAASHLHPSTSFSDLEPWLRSLATDLHGATTYQVTAEMIDLAVGLTETTPDLGDLVEEDIPAPWGFLWLDRPIPRPSVEDKPGDMPLLMQAVSWAQVPRIDVQIRMIQREEGQPQHIEGDPEDYGVGGQAPLTTVTVPGVRIREWGWLDQPGIIPRPLHLMGQSTAVTTPRVHTPLTHLHLIHMIWILMGMEIVASTPVRPGRGGIRRAANLAQHQVHVVTLRRQAHDPGAIRHVDWSCTWLVRGHWRKAPHGGTFADGRARTWIRPYIKGPEGLPLRASDLLYKLRR